VGHWHDDQKHGYGTYTWADQDQYIGYWKADQFHGHGIYINADGTRQEGIWENDEFVKEIRSTSRAQHLQLVQNVANGG
jgi:hypothetical protein